MRKIILNVAISYDGYISRDDGSVDFLDVKDLEGTDLLKSYLKEVDVIIMGRNTYDEYDKYGWDYLDGKRIIVLSSKKRSSKVVEFYNGSVIDLVESIDNGIWCFGGSKVIKTFMESDLIDEFYIVRMPVIIGSGKPLFEQGNYKAKLKLIESRSIGNVLIERLSVKR